MLLKLPKKFRKSGSRKSSDSKESVSSKPTEEEAEFGFNIPSPSEKMPLSPSSQNDLEDSVFTNESKSTKMPPSSSSHKSTPKQKETSSFFHHQPPSQHHDKSSSSAPKDKPPIIMKERSSRKENAPVAPNKLKHTAPPSRHPQQRKPHSNAKKRLGDNLQKPHVMNDNRNIRYYSEVSLPQTSHHQHENSLQRNNSMVYLNSWVKLQKQKRSSARNLDKSHLSPNKQSPGTYMSPSRGKRYKPFSYSDYMEGAEAASSIMSVPPMNGYTAMTLPRARPKSSQEAYHRRSSRHKMASSKSAGFLPPEHKHVTTASKTKSAQNIPHDVATVQESPIKIQNFIPSSSMEPLSTFLPQHNGYHVNKPPTYDFVAKNRSPSYCAAIIPTFEKTRYESVDSSKKAADITQQSSKDLHSRVENLKLKEDDIELKLKRLNKLDEDLRNLSSQIHELLNDKHRLEISMVKAKSNLTLGDGSEYELEEKLLRVKEQLFSSTLKLKQMENENEDFEREINKLKVTLLEELSKKNNSKSNQMQLEWELGKVQLIMEEVSKSKVGILSKIQSIEANNIEQEPLNTRISEKKWERKKHDKAIRSPRIIKTSSAKRRSPNNTLQRSKANFFANDFAYGEKYFTLPGHGVSRSNTLTAAQIARFTKALSSRNTNAHQTKSAAERLLSGSHASLGRQQDPNEIKRIQRKISESRRRKLSADCSSKKDSASPYMHGAHVHGAHVEVGIDVQMAIKHHRMPKVLQRAKRDTLRNEAQRQSDNERLDTEEHNPISNQECGYHEIDVTPDDITNDTGLSIAKSDVDATELHVGFNLNHQLISTDSTLTPNQFVERDYIALTSTQDCHHQETLSPTDSMLSYPGPSTPGPPALSAAASPVEAVSAANEATFEERPDEYSQTSYV